MKIIRFRCPTGHKVRANALIQGKRVACPRCRKVFQVPKLTSDGSVDAATPSSARPVEVRSASSGLLRTSALRPDDTTEIASIAAHDTVTESGAFQLLDQLDSRQVPQQAKPPRKTCPRCRQLVEHSARVCSHCHIYLGITDQQWHNTLDNAAREVVENPLRKRKKSAS